MLRAMWKVTFGLKGGSDNFESRNVIAVDASNAFAIARSMLAADSFDEPLDITGLLCIAREDAGAMEHKAGE